MSQIFIEGVARYVEVSAGYCLVNGKVLYIAAPFRIPSSTMVGAPGGDYGDYYVYLRPNRKVMESYYTQNWEYIVKSTSAGGTAPTIAPDELNLGRIEKRLDGTGNTVLTVFEANRRVSGDASVRLINSKDISDKAIQSVHLADHVVLPVHISNSGSDDFSFPHNVHAANTVSAPTVDASAFILSSVPVSVFMLASPGDIKISGRFTVPGGWLKCDGADYSRTTYADLFSAITWTTTASITSGSAVLSSIPSTSTFHTGSPISGPGIPGGTTILSIGGPSSITLSANATATDTAASILIAPYGLGNTTTTFNVPDFSTTAPIGTGHGLWIIKT